MNRSYFAPLVELFEVNCDDTIAPQMSRYMKNRFSFYGVKSPERKELQRQFIYKNGKLAISDAEKEVLGIWNNCKREVNYAIVDILKHKSYWQQEQSIDLAEWLIVHQSWWDTVDAIATHCVGHYMKQHPEKMEEYSAKWVLSDNMWLNRTAIIFQLKYKKETNFELLKQNIRHHSGNEEFFIRKAIGWALREYSKVAPKAVAEFITEVQLQNLSIREATKYL
jgi:3-methyladenine DNA glycosylase AlkD